MGAGQPDKISGPLLAAFGVGEWLTIPEIVQRLGKPYSTVSGAIQRLTLGRRIVVRKASEPLGPGDGRRATKQYGLTTTPSAKDKTSGNKTEKRGVKRNARVDRGGSSNIHGG